MATTGPRRPCYRAPARLKRLALIVVASGLVHATLAAIPDQMSDLLLYRQWTRGLVERGLAASYWPAPALDSAPAIDYPPVFPYALWATGRGLSLLAPGVLDSDRGLDFVVRMLNAVANILTTILLYFAIRGRAGEGPSAVVAALFALNPAVLFDSAYWGQADAVCAVLVVAALCWRARSAVLSWALLAAASLVKPMAWPLVPLFAMVAWREGGPKRALTGLAVSGAAALLILTPFAFSGRLVAILEALVTQVDAMPYASVNAHNLWWLFTGGLPWTRADAAWVGPLSCSSGGLLLFAAFYAMTLMRLGRSQEPRALERACASAAFGFFVLMTHMHENHLFLFLPLLLLADGERAWARRFFLAVTLAALANMALHDPLLSETLRPLTPGPRVLLPREPSLDPTLLEGLRQGGYGLLANQLRGDSSLLWVGLTLVNAQATVLLFAIWIASQGGTRRLRLSRGLATAIALFVLGTGIPFLARAAQMPRT